VIERSAPPVAVNVPAPTAASVVGSRSAVPRFALAMSRCAPKAVSPAAAAGADRARSRARRPHAALTYIATSIYK
jgi:hypothetical protein